MTYLLGKELATTPLGLGKSSAIKGIKIIKGIAPK